MQSLLLVLALAALFATSTAPMSSSSSYQPANASTGSVFVTSSPVSATGGCIGSDLPDNSYSIGVVIDLGYVITGANLASTANSVHGDLATNIAVENSVSNITVSEYLNITSINGIQVCNSGSSARRLLQFVNGTEVGVTFILLGSIANAFPNFDVTAAVNTFVTAAANGQLKSYYTNGTYPKQAISPPVNVGSNQGSTGAASSMASAGFALLFAAGASLALLL